LRVYIVQYCTTIIHLTGLVGDHKRGGNSIVKEENQLVLIRGKRISPGIGEKFLVYRTYVGGRNFPFQD